MPFVTAAGFAEASVIYDLEPPAFVVGNWTTSERSSVTLSNGAFNQTLEYNTIAIQTQSGCEPADTFDFTGTAATALSFTGTWNGCSVTINTGTLSTLCIVSG